MLYKNTVLKYLFNLISMVLSITSSIGGSFVIAISTSALLVGPIGLIGGIILAIASVIANTLLFYQIIIGEQNNKEEKAKQSPRHHSIYTSLFLGIGLLITVINSLAMYIGMYMGIVAIFGVLTWPISAVLLSAIAISFGVVSAAASLVFVGKCVLNIWESLTILATTLSEDTNLNNKKKLTVVDSDTPTIPLLPHHDSIFLPSYSENNSLIVHRTALPHIPGLIYQELPNEKHYLYHAVGLHVNQTPELLKNIVLSYLKNNSNDFLGFIQLKNKETFEGYLQDDKNSEWTNYIKLEILMRLINRPIIVIGWDGNIRNREVLERKFDNEPEPIFVYYNGRGHYDAFLRKEGSKIKDILNNLTQSNLYQQTPT